MTKCAARICSILMAACLPWSAASCSDLDEDVDRSGDDLETESISQATTCNPIVTRFPVNARHNTGFDWSSCTSTYCNLYCPPQAQTVSTSDYHGGIDIFADPGAPVVAAQAGTINWSFSDASGGNVVYVQDACGWNHYYAHLATIDPALWLGKYVTVGTPLGTVGNTGSAAGTQHHLHYGAYNESWTPTNPFTALYAVESTSCTSGGMNNNMPSGANIALGVTCISDSSYGVGWDCGRARDGVTSASSKWTSTGTTPTHYVIYDLGWTRTVNGYVVRHAGAGGEPTYFNTQQFRFESGPSTSGPWTIENVVDNNAQANLTTRSFTTPKAQRFIRLYITDPGIDNWARIPEFEVRGL